MTTDNFGHSVAVSDFGNTILAGAPLSDTTGEAFAFLKSLGAWQKQQDLTASDAQDGDQPRHAHQQPRFI